MNLHYVTAVDEQAGDADSLVKIAARIVAQVKDISLDALSLKLFNCLANKLRRILRELLDVDVANAIVDGSGDVA